jgi:hypothetical protein
MFDLFKSRSVDMVLVHHQKELEALRKQIGQDQKRMFQLALKTGYEWKHNKWVKRNV